MAWAINSAYKPFVPYNERNPSPVYNRTEGFFIGDLNLILNA
jgi:hypothetical protein